MIAGCGTRHTCTVALALVLLCGALPSARATQHQPAVVHVVLVWLKESGNSAHRRQVIERTRLLSEIPGMLEVRVGEPVASSRHSVDASFDVALYMVFESAAALEGYLVHPMHKEALEEVLRPLTERTRVYNFTDIVE